MTAVAKDMKESLGSGRKADLTHARQALLIYIARACEYGCAKYQRANFLRPVDGGPAADFRRLRAYVAAGLRHLTAMLEAMEAHEACDPELLDIAGMKRAAYCEDTDEDTTGKVGPSGLPHLAGACASLNMATAQAARYGLLPADPGQPWTKNRSQLDFTHATVTATVGHDAGATPPAAATDTTLHASPPPPPNFLAPTDKPCARSAGGICMTHNVPLDETRAGGKFLCRLTQREVP